MEFYNQPSFPVILFIWIASPIAWIIYAVWRAKSGSLHHAPRQQVPWGMIDIVILFVIVFLGIGMAFLALKSVYGIDISLPLEKMEPGDRAKMIVTSSSVSLVATFIALFVIGLRNRASLVDFGIHWRYIRDDLAIGVFAFILLAGPVFLIQGLLVLWWPSKHPLVELIMKNPDPVFFAVSGFSALIVAPLAEEFTYRVILQGWMERAVAHRGDPMTLLLGGRSEFAQSKDEVKHAHDEPIDAKPDNESQSPSAEGRPSVLPIVASAAIFALMHLGHGPDPIPLFVFALGLGYLYQRTHRILPCVIVHFLLNAVSLSVLMLDVYGTKA